MKYPTEFPRAAPPSEAAMKSRISSHMNAQHQPSMRRYLEHYHNVSPFAARSPRLADMTTKSMTILAPYLLTDVTYEVPLSPPLANLSEARTRLVEMDQQAAKALGRAPETVSRYKAPNTPYQITVFFAVLFGFFCFSSAANFRPGSWLTTTILAPVPPFARLLYQYQPLALVAMIVLHAWEALVMARTRLQKFNVPVGGRVWWMWVLSTFFEGFGAFLRFEEVIEEERRKKEDSKGH